MPAGFLEKAGLCSPRVPLFSIFHGTASSSSKATGFREFIISRFDSQNKEYTLQVIDNLISSFYRARRNGKGNTRSLAGRRIDLARSTDQLRTLFDQL